MGGIIAKIDYWGNRARWSRFTKNSWKNNEVTAIVRDKKRTGIWCDAKVLKERSSIDLLRFKGTDYVVDALRHQRLISISMGD